MVKGPFAFFRLVLFLAGAGVYALAFFLFAPVGYLLREDIFVWASIAVMYLVFFVPFFFSSINVSNFSGKIPVLSLAWTGIVIYILASIGLIYLLKYRDLSVNTAILFQAILLFLFFIDIYFAYFASAYARQVEAKEQTLRRYITEIKSQAQVLSLSADSLSPEFEGAKKTIKQALEEIKYLSPVSGGVGDDLETKILSSLNFLTELCEGLSSGLHPPALESEAKNLQMIIKQRKLLRN